jgi:hypothetical protein
LSKAWASGRLQKNGCEDRNCLVGDKKGFEKRENQRIGLENILDELISR